MDKRIYLIDGSGFIFRAYHALPPLTRADGTPVGAVYGFVNMLMKLMDSSKADYMAVLFDAKRETFRNQIYAEYKAHRPPPPEDLIPQFPLIREATEAVGLPSLEMEGYEADDLIATYAKKAKADGMEVVVVSSDKDLMQLVGEGVTMFDPMKMKRIDRDQVIEKFGVGPEKVREVLALMGDSSDNVPGVPGIGPKTAAELIQTFGDLESLLARLSEIKQEKRRAALTEHAEMARISHRLVCLEEDVPVTASLESFALKPSDPAKLLRFLDAQGFRALAAKLREKSGGEMLPPPADESAPQHPKHYDTVSSESVLRGWVEEARRAGIVAFDTETDSLDALQANLVGFSLCFSPFKACYVPLQHTTGEGQADLFAGGKKLCEGQLPLENALATLKPLLEDETVLKIGQNIKYDMLVMHRHGISIAPYDDTMLISYLLATGKHGHGMDELAQLYLKEKPIAYEEVTKEGKKKLSFCEVSIDKATAYAAEDADVTYRLWDKLKPKLPFAKKTALYETTERPLIHVIAEMEARGIKVDQAKLKELSDYLSFKSGGLEEEIYQLCGKHFTIGSPKQLGDILFGEMGLKGGKMGKSGAYGTDAGVLEDLAADGVEVAGKVLEWRQLTKLKSTYTEALQKQINPNTGRVHTSYSLAGTSTGRLSSSEPNLQNIPIRTEEGRKVREAFVAEQGSVLLSADYSQIELRLLAHVADIPSLKDAFQHGQDIHAATASQIFGVPLDQVGSDLRRSAKTINFGIIYGMSAHGLAVRLGISRSEAANYIELYFKQYPGIREYMDRSIHFARQYGYVDTLFGRSCYIRGINDKNPNIRNGAERQAINAPLQGTAADIIKRAMVAMPEALKKAGLQTQMLLQVHDELVFEAPVEEAETATALVKKVMEQAAHLGVPLTVETGMGRHWGEAH